MKKLSLLVFLFSICATAFSQQIRLNAYTNYVFEDNVNSSYSNTQYYNGQIQDGFQWGAGLEYMATKSYGIELSYLRQDTKIPIEYYRNGPRKNILDAGINYILLGGARHFSNGGKVEGFAGGSVGTAIISLKNAEENYSDNLTKFAWALHAGGNLWMSEKVGLKLQAQLTSAVQSVGGGFYLGTGGAGVGVNAYSTMMQFALGGGLVFRFDQQKKPGK